MHLGGEVDDRGWAVGWEATALAAVGVPALAPRGERRGPASAALGADQGAMGARAGATAAFRLWVLLLVAAVAQVRAPPRPYASVAGHAE